MCLSFFLFFVLIIQATRVLRQERMLNFTKYLSHRFSDNSEYRAMLSPAYLILVLHKEGFNVRHLGRIRALCSLQTKQSTYLRRIILVEMASISKFSE